MAAHTILHTVGTLMATVYPPVLALFAGLGLASCFVERPGAGGPKVRAVTALTAALVAAAVLGLFVADDFVLGPGFAWLLFAVLAVPLLVLPGVALALYDASAKAGGWLHSAAASPFFCLAIGMSGLVTLAGHAGDGFLFLLAPAALLFVLIADVARAGVRVPVRSNAEALRFLSPATGVAHCVVCLDPVRNRRVRCAACGAVQHRECVEFSGHCGGAGCISTRVR